MGDFDTTRQAYPLLTKEASDMGLGNIRNDTYGRVYTRREKSVLVKDYTQTGTVAGGGSETTTITPPSGKIWRVHNLKMAVNPDADASSGTHKLHVYFNSMWNLWLLGESDYNIKLDFMGGIWNKANVKQIPSTEVTQVEMMKGIAIGEGVPLKIQFVNDTDVGHDPERAYKLVVVEEWS